MSVTKQTPHFAVSVLLLCVAAGGCAHVRPHAKAGQRDPLSEWMSEIRDADREGPPLAWVDKVDKLQSTTLELSRRLDELDETLSARNAELIQTRNEHQQALKDISEMRTELQTWRTAMVKLQARLEEQDRQRLEDLDELSERINQIAKVAAAAPVPAP